jgi:hypothetical protein|tara:strand:+ start:134 stop:400 length:267 start_codon:yes stop_codon:yes gene_type:complete
MMTYDKKDFLNYLNAHNFDYVESDIGRVKKIGWFVFAELCMEDDSNHFDVVLFDTRSRYRDYEDTYKAESFDWNTENLRQIITGEIHD